MFVSQMLIEVAFATVRSDLIHHSSNKIEVNAWINRQVKLISSATRISAIILVIYELMANILIKFDTKSHK